MKNCTERFNWQKPYCRKWYRESCASSVFGMVDGSNKRGRPHREWSDDIEQWRGATLQELSHAALDRQRWAAIVRMASDTNGHWAHGCRWWWLCSNVRQFLSLMINIILILKSATTPCILACYHADVTVKSSKKPFSLSEKTMWILWIADSRFNKWKIALL